MRIVGFHCSTTIHTGQFQPRLRSRDHGELPHSDDATADLGDEERAGTLCDPAVEETGNAVLASPDRANGLADGALVPGSRGADDQLHAVILTDLGGAGFHQRHRRATQLALPHVAELDSLADRVGDERALQV